MSNCQHVSCEALDLHFYNMQYKMDIHTIISYFCIIWIHVKHKSRWHIWKQFFHPLELACTSLLSLNISSNSSSNSTQSTTTPSANAYSLSDASVLNVNNWNERNTPKWSSSTLWEFWIENSNNVLKSKRVWSHFASGMIEFSHSSAEKWVCKDE